MQNLIIELLDKFSLEKSSVKLSISGGFKCRYLFDLNFLLSIYTVKFTSSRSFLERKYTLTLFKGAFISIFCGTIYKNLSSIFISIRALFLGEYLAAF